MNHNCFIFVLFFVLFIHLSYSNSIQNMDILESMLSSFDNKKSSSLYSNNMASEEILQNFGSDFIIHSTNCMKTINQPCIIAKKFIKKNTNFLGIPTTYFITIDKVLRYIPNLKRIMQDNEELHPYISPTILFTLYVWSEADHPESLIMSWFELLNKYTFDRECSEYSKTINLPVCTPHMWSEKEQKKLYPSKIYEYIEEEILFIRNAFKCFQQHLFPYIPQLVETSLLSEDYWVYLFFNVRAFTFIRTYDQVDVFAFPIGSIPHNPYSNISIKWEKNYIVLQADKDYNKGDEISINYWELLGSLSSLIPLSDLNEYDVDPFIYETKMNATLNSMNILLHFGQLPYNNIEYTTLMISIKLQFDDIVVENILKPWIDKIDFIKNGVAEFRLQRNIFPEGFMLIARIVSLSLEDLDNNIYEKLQLSKVISLTNEYKAMIKVLRLINQYINSYPISDDEIDEIWSIHNLSLDHKITQRLRLHYNEIKLLKSAKNQLIIRWNDLIQLNTTINDIF